MDEILKELISVSPAAAVAIIALWINHTQTKAWMKQQAEQQAKYTEQLAKFSILLGENTEVLRRLNGKA